jgi:5-methylcytosine-specific restriction protein A
MQTYLLTWNPAQNRPARLDHVIDKIERGKHVKEVWSTGNRRDLPMHSRFFMLRQGVEPRGIIASGHTLSRPKKGTNPGDHSNYCKLQFTAVLDATIGHLIPLAELQNHPPLDEFNWSPQCGGILFEKKQSDELERLWANTLKRLGRKELPWKT